MDFISKSQLSVTIITKNNANTIEACLQSIHSIADEIIVLDSGSTDGTLEICQRYTNKVKVTDWQGFGIQKQRALNLAEKTWVLSIDADETLTQACQNAILHAIQNSTFCGYRIKRLMIFAGKTIYHSGCTDAPLRLFRREQTQFSDDIVHEYPIVNGKIGRISEPMLHYSYRNIGEWILKMNLYSELGAERKRSDAASSSLTKAITAAFISFIKMYFLKKGFLDGRLGLVAAINSAVASYYKYLKLALDTDFTLPPLNINK